MADDPTVRESKARLVLERAPPGIGVQMPSDGSSFDLNPMGTILGRTPECDVQIVQENSEALEALFQGGWGGRKNLRIVFENDRWLLEHLGHQGRIRVNGEDVMTTRDLEHGDEIVPSLGLMFRFELDSESR